MKITSHSKNDSNPKNQINDLSVLKVSASNSAEAAYKKHIKKITAKLAGDGKDGGGACKPS